MHHNQNLILPHKLQFQLHRANTLNVAVDIMIALINQPKKFPQ
jgi:hypothetical protein